MYKPNSQFNRSFKNTNLRRTLLRTESSLEKIIETKRQGQVIKIKHLLHNQLRYSSLQKSLQRQKSGSAQKFVTESSEVIPHQRQKGRSLFKKSKFVHQNQTFLCRIKKQKKSVLQTLTEQKGREKAKLHANGTINSAFDKNTQDKTSFLDSKQTVWNLNSNKKQSFTPVDARYRTISYDKQPKGQDQTMSQNFSNKQKMERIFKRLNSHHSSFKTKVQNLKQDKIKIELSESLVGQQKLNKLQQQEQKLITFEPRNQGTVNRMVSGAKQPKIKAINTKIKTSAEYRQKDREKANQFFNRPVDLCEDIPEIITIQRQTNLDKEQGKGLNASRQNIYQEIDNVNQFYIEEITFGTTTNVKNNTGNEPVKTHNQNNHLEGNNDQNNAKRVTNQQSSKLNEENSIINSSHIKSEDQSKSGDNNKQKIMQRIVKINHYRQQLQMLGELAAFFSKNSKAFKMTEESKIFMKNGAVTWHLLVYFFFKYFYSMNLLFLHYFKRLQEQFILNKAQLTHYTQQMNRLGQTLKKIEKSTRKATHLTQDEEQLITDLDYLKDLQNSQWVNQITYFYIDNQGQQANYEFTSFLKDLRESIFSQSSKFIKNMNIANILNDESDLATVFFNGLFRIFNSCTILYKFCTLRAHSMETMTSIQKLTDPQVVVFQKFYVQITQQVLKK